MKKKIFFAIVFTIMLVASGYIHNNYAKGGFLEKNLYSFGYECSHTIATKCEKSDPTYHNIIEYCKKNCSYRKVISTEGHTWNGTVTYLTEEEKAKYSASYDTINQHFYTSTCTQGCTQVFYNGHTYIGGKCACKAVDPTYTSGFDSSGTMGTLTAEEQKLMYDLCQGLGLDYNAMLGRIMAETGGNFKTTGTYLGYFSLDKNQWSDGWVVNSNKALANYGLEEYQLSSTDSVTNKIANIIAGVAYTRYMFDIDGVNDYTGDTFLTYCGFAYDEAWSDFTPEQAQAYYAEYTKLVGKYIEAGGDYNLTPGVHNFACDPNYYRTGLFKNVIY